MSLGKHENRSLTALICEFIALTHFTINAGGRKSLSVLIHFDDRDPDPCNRASDEGLTPLLASWKEFRDENLPARAHDFHYTGLVHVVAC
jgi:hypothetical protein